MMQTKDVVLQNTSSIYAAENNVPEYKQLRRLISKSFKRKYQQPLALKMCKRARANCTALEVKTLLPNWNACSGNCSFFGGT